MRGRFAEARRDWKTEPGENFARVYPARRMALRAVHEDAEAVAREKRGGEDKPGQLPALAGVGGPIEIGLRQRRRKRHRLACSADETGDFLGAFLLHPKQHQKRAELLRQNLAG